MWFEWTKSRFSPGELRFVFVAAVGVAPTEDLARHIVSEIHLWGLLPTPLAPATAGTTDGVEHSWDFLHVEEVSRGTCCVV